MRQAVAGAVGTVTPMPESATLPTVEDALALGLTRAEYELVCAKQGRPPNQVELAMYSLLWSEHCAYKHSKQAAAHASHRGSARGHGPGRERRRGRRRRRPGVRVQGRVPQPPQRGRALPGRRHRRRRASCATSSRSALARSRCSTRCASASRRARASRYLLDGAVSGIAHYGNSIGVPTVGGEVYFEAPYEQNCLVNAMALGLAQPRASRAQRRRRARQRRVLFGASTGRDGIGGASVLASAELGGDGTRDKRPTVQVGDPFEEKKLLECSLELLDARPARLAAGPRRRRPDLLGVGDGLRRAASGSTSTSSPCPCASPTWSPSRSWSPSPRSGCCASSSPRNVAAVLALCEKLGGARRGDRHGHRHAAHARACDGELRRRHAGQRARGRLPAV